MKKKINYLFSIILFGISIAIIYMFLSDNTSLFEISKHLQTKTIYRVIDKQINEFFTTNSFNIALSRVQTFNLTLAELLMVSLVFYAINLWLFKNVTFPFYTRFKIKLIFKPKVIIKFFSLYLPFLLIYTVPLTNAFSTADYLLIVFVMISIIVIVIIFILNILMDESIEDKPKLPILYFQILLTFSLSIIVLFNTDWGGIPTVYNIMMVFFFCYVLIGVSFGTFNLVLTIIMLDFRAATIAKENLFIGPPKSLKNKKIKFMLLHPINRYSPNLNHFEIEEVINNRLHVPLYERKNERGKLINNRNKTNFYISIIMSLLFWVNILALNIWSFKSEIIEKWLILSFLFLFIRLSVRSIEIIKAFYEDIISNQVKKSNLRGEERLMLAIFSLIEITILTAFISYFYEQLKNISTLSNSAWSISEYLRETVLVILQHFSIQVFNISFDLKVGFVLNIVHTIQITTSFCLIFLAIASYIGFKNTDSEYEVIQKNEKWILKEWVYISKTKNTHFVTQKIIRESNSPFIHDKLWDHDKLTTDEYIKIKKAYFQWIAWKEENERLKKKWLNYGKKE